MSVELLEGALPASFPFYHLGAVELRPRAKELPRLDDQTIAIGFSLRGDLTGLLAVVFQAGLDPSVYSELGNIIASQVSGRLSRDLGRDVLISPPRPLSRAQLAHLASGAAPLLVRSYWHTHGEKTIPLQTWISTYPLDVSGTSFNGESGNA